jgi:hypothetical protein
MTSLTSTSVSTTGFADRWFARAMANAMSLGLLVAAAIASLALGAGLTTPRGQEAVLALVAVVGVVAALKLPPHMFLGLSVVVLASSQVSEAHPFIVGPVTVYTSDLMLGLVLLRAALPRARSPLPRLVTPGLAAPILLWVALALYAGARGYASGNSTGQIARLETSMVYLLGFTWGFTRVASEMGMSVRRTVRTLAVVALGFVGFALYTRVVHQRFAGATGYGVGNVVTNEGVLRRDYGLFTAFELYPLIAVVGLACLFYLRRPGRTAALVTCIGLAATVMTLVRGMIFGVAAAVAVLGLLALKDRGLGRVVTRLLVVLALLGIAAVPFAWFSPRAASGVAERVLPGLVAQNQNADYNAQFRVTVLQSGVRLANQKPVGLGFVSADSMTLAGYEPLYIPHSQWGSLLAFEGWPGLILFVWVMAALARRSSRLPAATRWLHPMLLGLVTFNVVEGFAWNVLFSMVSGMGMLALLIGLRFGARASDDEDVPLGQALELPGISGREAV